MERLDFYASERHYLDHLLPIWQALPDDARGGFYVGTRRDADLYADELGFQDRHRIDVIQPPDRDHPTVVASFGDEKACAGRPVALLEHGAGQHYGTGNSGYSGGVDRDEVGLFLCPSETVAVRNREVYPDAEMVIVGCPKLDPWHEGRLYRNGGVQTWPDGTVVRVRGPLNRPPFCVHCADPLCPGGDEPGDCSGLDLGGDRRPTVAISFHWPTPGPPEAGTAFPYFEGVLRDLARRYPTVLGHAHPKMFGQVVHRYEAAGIEPVRNFADILDRADVYVCDNSSTIYEFASTGRPVVLMNSPKYRHDVEHGLRFWSLASVGIQADNAAALLPCVDLALEDPPVIARERARCVAEVYEHCDGRNAERAAAALLDWRPDRSKIRRIHKG